MIKKAVFLLACLSLVLSLAVWPSNSQAQNSANNVVGATVSPVLDEFTIEPGAAVTRVFKLSNPIGTATTFYPLALNFTTDNQSGLPTFYTIGQHDSPHSLSDWISFKQTSITVAPGQSAEFAATIRAPANAEPGGHYGSVLFSTEPPKTDSNANQVSVVGLIGSLLLVTVPGDITQSVSIENFTAPTFLLRPPANFSLLLNNSGNIHVLPTGDIKIQNWVGAAKVLLPVNEANGNVLPGSQRLFANRWSFNWWAIGRYTVTANVVYGSPEQHLISSRTFMVIPIWFLVLIGLIIILIVWLLIRRNRHRGVPTLPISPLPPIGPRGV